MKNQKWSTIVVVLLVLFASQSAFAAYGVRISDLNKKPLPPNPVKVWGKVVSESPLKISDGKADTTVTGAEAEVGDYLVVTGDWNGSVLNANGSVNWFIGNANTEMVYIPAGRRLERLRRQQPLRLPPQPLPA